jgi:aldehyde:ferredoxin oxidoreductase
VDLTNEEVRIEPLDRELIRKYLGGWGINIRLASDLIGPETDPLSPENPIVLGVGPLVGAPVPGSAKVVATTKFPATWGARPAL